MAVTRRILVKAIDEPTATRVTVSGGIPRRYERKFEHDGGMSDRHKQALRDAAARAEKLATKYKCQWRTNY